MKRSIWRYAGLGLALVAAPAVVEAQADLNDLEMAHVAVTASNIDIEYALIALAISENAEVRRFAETMVRDHRAVNGQVAELAQQLGVTAQDNEMSRSLLAGAAEIRAELLTLRGVEFDRRYMENEKVYHQTVNGVVSDVFIPNIENAQVKSAFEGALQIFLVHQEHAERIDRMLSEWEGR